MLKYYELSELAKDVNRSAEDLVDYYDKTLKNPGDHSDQEILILRHLIFVLKSASEGLELIKEKADQRRMEEGLVE